MHEILLHEFFFSESNCMESTKETSRWMCLFFPTHRNHKEKEMVSSNNNNNNNNDDDDDDIEMISFPIENNFHLFLLFFFSLLFF
jgi:hypothetical protein